MSDETGRGRFSSGDFESLKLRGGTRLQLRSFFDAAPDCEVEFVAALRGKSIFVALPSRVAGDIQIGNRYLVRGFNGTSEFAFNAEVLQVEQKPFLHAHIAYPDSVDMRMVRSAQRIQTSLPVLVQPEGAGEGILGTILDMSVAGALIESVSAPGEVGDKIAAVLACEFEKNSVELRIPATIRHINRVDEEGIHRCGVEFGRISQNDRLILYYLLFTLADGV